MSVHILELVWHRTSAKLVSSGVMDMGVSASEMLSAEGQVKPTTDLQIHLPRGFPLRQDVVETLANLQF
jgi:hypothetical protein